INYIWIDKIKLGNIFHKCLCANVVHEFYKNKYDYDFLLWHDVDCAIQFGFYNAIKTKLSINKCLQTYPNKFVIYTKKELANDIRNGKIDINSITPHTSNINPIQYNASGG